MLIALDLSSRTGVSHIITRLTSFSETRWKRRIQRLYYLRDYYL